MFVYAVPMISLLLVLMATLTCFRFIMSRQGAYWLLPCLISFIFTVENFNTILDLSSNPTGYNPQSFNSIAPLLIAIMWYMMIIGFHYALRYKIDVNKYRNENRKNRTEAKYIEKLERRKQQKEFRIYQQNSANSHLKPEIYAQKDEKNWSDLFSD